MRENRGNRGKLIDFMGGWVDRQPEFPRLAKLALRTLLFPTVLLMESVHSVIVVCGPVLQSA